MRAPFGTAINGNTVSKYFGFRILSTAKNREISGYLLNKSWNCSMAFRGDMDRYCIVRPLSPQNVQCDFSPHQQPRDVSKKSKGSTSGQRSESDARKSSYSRISRSL